MGYLQRETLPKALTSNDDINKGEISLKHLHPGLFLEINFIKLHNHSGIDSRQLGSNATPEMVKAYRPNEREEHGLATWTGSAASNGSVVLTFGTAFSEVPEVFAVAQSGNANIIIGTNTPTATGVTIYWRDETAATRTSLVIAWLAKGR